MDEQIVEGVVLEHPDEFGVIIHLFNNADYAHGFLDACAEYGEWTGELLSTVDPHDFVSQWYDDEDGDTTKSDAIKQIEDAKKRLTNQ